LLIPKPFACRASARKVRDALDGKTWQFGYRPVKRGAPIVGFGRAIDPVPIVTLFLRINSELIDA
jgi:hypothetical protein